MTFSLIDGALLAGLLLSMLGYPLAYFLAQRGFHRTLQAIIDQQQQASSSLMIQNADLTAAMLARNTSEYQVLRESAPIVRRDIPDRMEETEDDTTLVDVGEMDESDFGILRQARSNPLN